MRDPMGMVLRELAADAAIAGIASDRVSSVEGASGSALLTRVVLKDLGASVTPYGAGSGRLGMQEATYAADCFGPKNAITGPVTARQLAGAVVDVMHDRGPRVDASGRGIYRSSVVSVSPLLKDPDTGEPFHTVAIQIVAMAQAVA